MITNRQVSFMLFCIMFGFGSTILPKILAQQASTGGWVSILFASIMTMILTNITAYNGYINKEETIVEYSKKLVGKYFSIVIMIIYALFMFTMLTLINRLSCELIKNSFLVKTPIWFLLIIFIVSIYYILSKGINTIARICELYGLIILIISFSIHILISIKGNILNIKPYFVAQDMKSYINGAIKSKLAFSGMIILSVIPFKGKQTKRIFLYLNIMILIIALLYIVQFESAISIMGADNIIYFNDALISAIRRVELPFLHFLRRLDGISLVTAILSFFLNTSLYAYGTVFILDNLFRKVPTKIVSFIVLVISFFISTNLPKYENTIEIFNSIGLVGLLGIGTINVVLLIISKVKSNDKEKV